MKLSNRIEIYTEINWYIIDILPCLQFRHTPNEKLLNNTFLGRTEIVFSWLIFGIGLFIRNK